MQLPSHKSAHTRVRLAILVLGVFSLNPTAAYNVPLADNSKINAHGKMILDAVKYLGNFKSDPIAASAVDFLKDKQTELLNGQYHADADGGKVGPVERNTLTHFYNPKTQKGFVAITDEAIAPSISRIALAWKVSQALGPNTPSTEMSDWFFGRAQVAYKNGEMREAARLLSYSVHYVQDATVPQHTTDCGSHNPKCNHVDYEDYVDGVYDTLPNTDPLTGATTAAQFPKNPFESMNSNFENTENWVPSQFVAAAAGISSTRVASTASNERSNQLQAARVLTRMSVILSAAMLRRFMEAVTAPEGSPKQIRTVFVRIDKVEEKKGTRNCRWYERCKGITSSIFNDIAKTRDASFFPKVRIGESDINLSQRGHASTQSVVYPQSGIDSNGWIFARAYTPGTPSTVDIEVQMWDMDTICTGWFGACQRQIDTLSGPGLSKTRAVPLWPSLLSAGDAPAQFPNMPLSFRAIFEAMAQKAAIGAKASFDGLVNSGRGKNKWSIVETSNGCENGICVAAAEVTFTVEVLPM